jgi:hypothetical protein
MKKKNLIIVLVVVAVLLIGGVPSIILNRRIASAPVAQVPQEEQILTIKPEEIGLDLTASSDNHELILEVAKTTGISALDYELSYTSKGDIPRGVMGHIDMKTLGKAITQKITLGTCSDVCHYDVGVSNIKLILKVAKTDGTTSQVEKSLELSQ